MAKTMTDAERAEKERLRTEYEAKQERRRKISNAIGLVILTVALGWSVIHVAYLTFFAPGESVAEDKTVIRFAHWQLEGRTVEALNQAAEDYMKLHPDVIVKQIEVPERGYEQWVKTQLIGRTAPDLIELRTWKWRDFINRYFEPVAVWADEPNPYNADDPNLAGKSWRETYVDGMMGGWIEDLQALYGIPITMFTMRIYANRQMLEEATGSSKAPKTLGELLETCRKIEAWVEKNNRNVVPIAGADYVANMFRDKYYKMGTWGLLEPLDENLDGTISEGERLMAFFSGKLRFSKNPHIRAAHTVLYDITRFFNKGFMAAKRDQAVFLFAQGNAAMIATGSWDAGTLWEQVEDQFEIAVFDFPAAAPDDPEYGKYIRYRVSEADTRSGFCMGLTKLSQNKDRVIDFMHFLTSRNYNEKLNKRFRWVPAIEGAEPDPILRPFEPKVAGIYEAFKMEIGSKTRLEYEQAYEKYISTEIARENDTPQRRRQHYQQFIEGYADAFEKFSLEDCKRGFQNKYTAMEANKATVAQMRLRAVLRGMVDDVQGDARRNLQAVVFGQAKRQVARNRERQELEQIEQMVKDKTRSRNAGQGPTTQPADGEKEGTQ
ncbi:MAG: ABC transporter substrate-binding protein [Phycisphaerae bacterium]